MDFEHRAMDLKKDQKVVFIAMSKKASYFKRHAVKYVIDQGKAPISQFGIFGYFLLDSVDRDEVRQANNTLIRNSNELWVFGPVSDGVLAEIKLANEWNMPVKYFKIIDDREVEEVQRKDVEFEGEVIEHKGEIQ
jgi:hypothetical protein